jgi:hypothetical protein
VRPVDVVLTVGHDAAIPTGGYRVLVRDVAGPGDADTAFDVLDEITVLAPLVAEHRPVTFDGGRPWRNVSTLRTEIQNNHGHDLVTALATLDAPADITMLLTGNETHRHRVVLTADQLRRLTNGEDVAVTSSPADAGAAHTHLVTITGVRRRFVDPRPSGPGIEAKAAKWLDDKVLPALFEKTKTGPVKLRRRSAPKPTEPRADLDKLFQGKIGVTWGWPLVGRVMDVLHGAGCTEDLVVSGSGDWRAQLDSITASLQLPDSGCGQVGLTWLTATNPDGFDLKTVRLAVVPYDWLMWLFDSARISDKNDALRARVLAIAQVPRFELRDGSGAPVHLTMREQRRVTHVWNELVERLDPWHHELELVVQLLDRYAHVRPKLFGTERAKAPTIDQLIELEKHAPVRTPVSVPRWAPVQDTPAVAPVPVNTQDRVAFRVLESPTRFTASANALARTRVGRVQLNYSPYRRLPRAEAYPAFIPDALVEKWNDLVKVPAGIQAMTPVASAEIEPLPFSDVFEIVDAPYWYVHGVSVYVSADARFGPTSTAEQARRPRLLGLPELPSFKPVANGIEIAVRLARLGSHVTESEAKVAQRIDEQFVLGAFAPDAKPKHRDLLVERLPDLELEYDFLFDVSRDPRKLRFMHLATLSAIGQAGDSPQSPLGFALKNVATNLKNSRLERPDAASDLLRLTLDLDAAQKSVLDTDPRAQRVFVLLRRGALVTPSPLKCGAGGAP